MVPERRDARRPRRERSFQGPARFTVIVAVTLFELLAACRSKGQGLSDEGGGSEGGAPMDGSAVRDVGSPEASPSDSATGTADALAPTSGGGTLEGSQAFEVGTALMTASVGGQSKGCNAQSIPSGLVPAISIALLPTDVTPAQACGDAGPPEGDAGTAIFLGVATTQWAMTLPLTESLMPGTYTISNEHQNGEDLCMLVAPGTAFLLASPLGGTSTSLAVSGTITLSHVSATSASGAFQVLMGGPDGMDASSPDPLSGTFDAVACP